MNSFAFLERGIRAEIERQTRLLEAGEPVVQETLHFDPAHRSADPAALQGGGARLPLLPRARPGAAAGHRGDARRGPGRAARRAAGRAGGAVRAASSACSADTGPRVRLPGRARRLLRARAGRRPAANGGAELEPVELSNWIPPADRADRLRRRSRRAARSRPESLATLAAMVKAKEVSRDAAREVLTPLVAGGRRPARDRRARGPRRAQRRGRRPRRGRRSGDRRRPGRGRAGPRRQHEGDRPAGRLRDARDQGPRGRWRGHSPDSRTAEAELVVGWSVQPAGKPADHEASAQQRAASGHEQDHVEPGERQRARRWSSSVVTG